MVLVQPDLIKSRTDILQRRQIDWSERGHLLSDRTSLQKPEDRRLVPVHDGDICVLQDLHPVLRLHGNAHDDGVLSGHEEIEVCEAYELNGKILTEFPFTDVLDDCKPVFKKMKGWNSDISACRKKEDLPKEALDYIRYIERACNCKIRYVSVGAERDAYIEM